VAKNSQMPEENLSRWPKTRQVKPFSLFSFPFFLAVPIKEYGVQNVGRNNKDTNTQL
jgi:hypothetical protein